MRKESTRPDLLLLRQKALRSCYVARNQDYSFRYSHFAQTAQMSYANICIYLVKSWHFRGNATSVNVRLRCPRCAFKKIKITAFIGLRDMRLEQPPVTATMMRWRSFPIRPAALQFRLIYQQIQRPCGNVQCNQVAVT